MANDRMTTDKEISRVEDHSSPSPATPAKSAEPQPKPISEEPRKAPKRRPLWHYAAGALGIVILVGIVWMLRRPPQVLVGQARREDIVRTLAVTGRVRPQASNQVSPLVSGQVLELPRREGERIRKGDLLARIESSTADAEVARARATLAARQSEARVAAANFRRSQALNANGLISLQEFERSRADAQSAVATAKEAEQALQASQSQAENYVLRSPIDGVILTRRVDVGQNVSPGTVLFEIATNERSDIEADLDERYLPELRVGTKAEILLAGNTRQTYPATLCYISREISLQTGAAVVRFCLDDGTRTLPAGLSADVNIEVERHPNAISVPRAAIGGAGQQRFVYVIEDGRSVRKPVSVIDWPAERVVVTKGLNGNETVITNPKDVIDGARVRPKQAPERKGAA
jgi:RND family efflux transporter MFP subunit